MALNNSNNLNNNTSKPSTGAKQPGDLLVRIDQDSAENLQALFDSVLRPHDTTRKLTKPFRMRDLPPSFFNPPLTGSKSPSVSHSRENSADSAFGSGTTTICSPSGVNPNVNRLPISHSRAHSSPASLQQTYAGLNNNSSNNNSNATTQQQQQQQGQQTQSTTQTIQPVHMKQRSYDVVSAIQLQEELGELPAGWEQARTAEGQIYYLNHLTRTTQWEDPRKQVAAQPPLSQHQSTDSLLARTQQIQQQQQQQQQATSQAATAASKPIISSNALGQLGTLPEGWEQAVTSAGETYFINHINRTTSWFDPRVPRIPEQFQRSNPLSAPRIEMNVGLGNTSYINIHKLKREVDSLKQRQQEIQLFNQDLLARQNQQSIAHQMDPFLSGVTDHTRQESADSGLSVSSTNYSMPHTPDFMANIDDSMDCISESGTMESINTNLESTDDLVPSLHQLGDGFSNELLDDVHNLIDTAATKPLTWL